MKIAILGWGSLMWDVRPDFDDWHDPWQYDGPSLRIEFSRISDTRSGALTLVIDEEHGTPTRVAWCLSKREDLNHTVTDLRSREGTSLENIGRIEVPPPTVDLQRPEGNPLAAWARSKGIDCVVWTALKPRFAEVTKEPFTVPTAAAYLKNLGPAGKAEAMEYVRRAPPFVQTYLRSVLESEPGFATAET